MHSKSTVERAYLSKAAPLILAIIATAALAHREASAQSEPRTQDTTATSSPINASPAPIKVLHTPASGREIPALGSMMRITLELTNTYDIETKVRLVGSKDGRFIDIAFPQGALNNADRPTFNIDIPSPIAAMSYQFIVHQKDGTLTSTPKYLIKRDCLQTFAVDVPESDQSAAYKREVGLLVAKAKSLERDTASLEASLKLLEDMKTSLAK
ncbi:MAG: hypothetical protein ACK5Y6_10725 [Pseudomonadota bacterium]|jgi:hypothetical protein